MKKLRIGEQNIRMRETKSPGDIIWYNRGVDRKFQLKRAAIVLAIIFVTTIVAFFLFNFEIS